MNKKFKAVFFDLDNTLFHATDAYHKSLLKIGIDPDGAPYQEARKKVKNTLPAGSVQAHNRLLYFKEMLTLTQQFSPKKLLDLTHQYEDALAEETRKQWEGLKRAELLHKIKNRSPMALITNENLRTQMIKLQSIDPTGNLFQAIITSEEVGYEKPHVKMFERALHELKIAPQECLMVGDDLEADIIPSLNLGMSAVLSSEFTQCPDPSKDIPASQQSSFLQIHRLDQLIGVLDL